jgi:hypothetical protein
MSLKWYVNCLPFLIIGVYMAIIGITSKTLISESDVIATEEERARAKATPLRRLVVIGAGIASVVYGLFCSRYWLTAYFRVH